MGELILELWVEECLGRKLKSLYWGSTTWSGSSLSRDTRPPAASLAWNGISTAMVESAADLVAGL